MMAVVVEWMSQTDTRGLSPTFLFFAVVSILLRTHSRESVWPSDVALGW